MAGKTLMAMGRRKRESPGASSIAASALTALRPVPHRFSRAWVKSKATYDRLVVREAHTLEE